jgi:hypothetical protein
MSSIEFRQGKEYLRKRYEEMRAEYDRLHININALDHKPSIEEFDEINKFNLCVWKELGGSGSTPSE